ncbi:MAG: hypothetical protein JSV04_06360 [Candidatus Heimdallarchaeota archaeon]|nr:MAG: hypothetical protein JSV04_06360 [Candidatus Heimdallarchaeota archaeon]
MDNRDKDFLKDSNESGEKQPHHVPDHLQQKYSPIDFWSSRGNMGEKINIIVGFNLLLINLFLSYFQNLKEEALTDDIVETLTMIEEFLSTMQTHPESGLETLEKIKMIQRRVSTLLDEFTQPETIEKTILEAPTDIAGIFRRNALYLDKWGLIETIEKMLSSYSNLSHLAIPNFYFDACKELLHYELLTEFSSSDSHEIFQIPSFEIMNLISKLLREAPAARLLQNLRRMFPEDHDSSLTSSEQEQVQSIVKKYYQSISEYSDDGRKLQDSIRVSSGILKNYNLGAGDMESRIPNVSFSIVKNIQQDLKSAAGNDFKQYILSETIILIDRLNNTMIENEKFAGLLRRLK